MPTFKNRTTFEMGKNVRFAFGFEIELSGLGALLRRLKNLLGMKPLMNDPPSVSQNSSNVVMDHPFVFRPGTFDEQVFQHVAGGNEYELPNTFDPEDVIVDIGVHIGSFSYAALTRGANRVYGFEAEKENYECASQNLRSFGDRVSLQNKAVWRSDRRGDKLSFTPSTDETNTAGGNVVFSTAGVEVDTVPFDEIINDVTNGGKKRLKLLKIDCEGSEFPILFTSKTLHLIDSICGEFHEFGGDYDSHFTIPEISRVEGYDQFTIKELTEILENEGFTVKSERSGETNLGLFFANREIQTSQ